MWAKAKAPKWSALGPSLAAALVGCRFLVQTDERQCSVDADCAVRGGPLGLTKCVDSVCTAPPKSEEPEAGAPVDPKWGCLGKVTFGVSSVDEQITLRLRFVSLVSEQGLPDLLPRSCKALDAACATPFSTAEAPSDDSGYVTIRVPKWFDGYLEVQPPASFPDMLPAIIGLTPHEKDSDPTAEIDPRDAPHMVSKAEMAALFAQTGVTPNPERGHLIALMRDCAGGRAAGVALRTSMPDVDTVQFYLQGLTPSTTLTATDEAGIAGFGNLRAGYQTLSYSLIDGRPIGTKVALARAGWLTTLAELGPTP